MGNPPGIPGIPGNGGIPGKDGMPGHPPGTPRPLPLPGRGDVAFVEREPGRGVEVADGLVLLCHSILS